MGGIMMYTVATLIWLVLISTSIRMDTGNRYFRIVRDGAIWFLMFGLMTLFWNYIDDRPMPADDVMFNLAYFGAPLIVFSARVVLEKGLAGIKHLNVRR